MSNLNGSVPSSEQVKGTIAGKGNLVGRLAMGGAYYVGIESIEQTKTSTEDGGVNEVTITLTDGSEESFEVRNGSQGPRGPEGAKGMQGPQGEAGPQGPKGDKGDTGERGQDGADGKDGHSGVYVGSGEMPDNCNVQIDPNGGTDDVVTHAELEAILGIYITEVAELLGGDA